MRTSRRWRGGGSLGPEVPGPNVTGPMKEGWEAGLAPRRPHIATMLPDIGRPVVIYVPEGSERNRPRPRTIDWSENQAAVGVRRSAMWLGGLGIMLPAAGFEG